MDNLQATYLAQKSIPIIYVDPPLPPPPSTIISFISFLIFIIALISFIILHLIPKFKKGARGTKIKKGLLIIMVVSVAIFFLAPIINYLIDYYLINHGDF